MRRPQQHSFLLFASVAVVSLSASSALAYAPWPTTEPCIPNCLGKPVTIRYTIGNIVDGTMKMPNEQPVPIPLIRASIEEALHVWANAVNINFVEVPDGPLTDLRFRHLFINGQDPPPPADPIAKAQATCLGFGAGCEVQYDEADRWQEAGTTPNPDFLGATIHEVGHIIGLEHTSDPTANMYWIFHRFQSLGTGQLLGDDLSRIQSLYGAGVGSVTPMGVPEPSSCLLLCAAAMAGAFVRRRR